VRLPEQPDPEEIAAAERAAAEESRECAGEGDPIGTVTAGVRFAPSGRVTDAELDEGPLDGGAAAACALRALRAMRVMPFTGASKAVAFPLSVGRPPPPPSPPPGCQTTSVRLAPEIIQRLVREHFPVYRACYEAGLRRDLTLHGLVSIRFVIGIDGKVVHVSAAGSDLPDTRVRQCVRHAFEALAFPPPSCGTVTVTYPLALSVEQ
jgi:hypothetical protein